MARINLLVAASILLTGGSSLALTDTPRAAVPDQKVFEDLRGSDWAKMPQGEKQRFIYTGIGGLERQGVFISRSPQEYLEAMDKLFAADPSLDDEYLDNLFVFLVHDGEPQARGQIDSILKAQKV
jgi:hypothetical protein